VTFPQTGCGHVASRQLASAPRRVAHRWAHLAPGTRRRCRESPRLVVSVTCRRRARTSRDRRRTAVRAGMRLPDRPQRWVDGSEQREERVRHDTKARLRTELHEDARDELSGRDGTRGHEDDTVDTARTKSADQLALTIGILVAAPGEHHHPPPARGRDLRSRGGELMRTGSTRLRGRGRSSRSCDRMRVHRAYRLVSTGCNLFQLLAA